MKPPHMQLMDAATAAGKAGAVRTQKFLMTVAKVAKETQASPTIRKVQQTGLTPVLRGQPRTGQASAGRRLSED